jgi:hypothetical protein
MPGEIPIPTRMRHLPQDKHGRVVPWFVAWIDRTPDFRVVREDGIEDALSFQSCWLCGHRLGKFVSFVIGPMCALNRVSAEPGSHAECATYAARACPFLANPDMKRRERNKPEHVEPGGVMILRNPGVALVWTSRTWKPFRVPGGILIDVGQPVSVAWYAHGRDATRAEVLASIESGLPLLRQEAAKDPRAQEALAELDEQHARALELVPAAATEA